jgi:hypothetical protein
MPGVRLPRPERPAPRTYDLADDAPGEKARASEEDSLVMRWNRVTTLLLLLCAVPALSSAAVAHQAVSKCFHADALQGGRMVTFKLDGAKVSGVFTTEGADGAAEGVYNFTGTRRGDSLAVVFENGARPDVSPSEMRDAPWLLAGRGGRELLRIKFYGKNYQTNRYEESFVDFEPCATRAGEVGEEYAVLARGARVIRFARGATSASVRLDSLGKFQAMEAKAAFSVNAARSQTLEVRADGCVIEIYLPGGQSLYEYAEWEAGGEKTFASSAIDRFTIERLPKTGDYLVVLRKAAETVSPDKLTVTVRQAKATPGRRE